VIAGKCMRIALILALIFFSGAAAAEPFRVLTQNMNRLFDDVDDGNREKILSHRRFHQRINAAAEKFGQTFSLPHIIALQEVENFNVLNRVSAEIHRRYGTRYRPILLPGDDPSGINLGYLVRQGVEIRKIEQLFHDSTYGTEEHTLFTRPPLYLEACYAQHCLTLVNLHLRSMRGIDSDRDGARVRRKRLAQAEAIARWSNSLQNSATDLSLLILGDFNALTPPDEHVDVAGIILGNPDNRTTRLRGRDLVQLDLIDLTRMIPPNKRFSFVFRRNKQQLDYMFVNQGFAAEVEYITFSGIDRRFSDHAGLLAWFSW